MNAPDLTNQALVRESTDALTKARSLTIATPAQYEEAGSLLQGIKALRKRVGEFFDPHIKRAHEAHKALVQSKSGADMPLVQAENACKLALLAYQQQEERQRREEQAKAEELARKEREKLEARAAKAEAAGKVEKAAALQAVAETVAAPVIARQVPAVSGISTRTTYGALVVDKMELVKAVAAGTVPLMALHANEPFLNQQARALKEELCYPGVKVVTQQGIASR